MQGLGEIRKANDIAQTKRESDYRVQRDRLAQVLRKVLGPKPTGVGTDHLRVRDVAAETAARDVLAAIYGERT